MREKEFLAWLFIFVSTNLFTGAQGSLNVQVKAVENNHSCVDVSWRPASSSQYTVNCNGTEPVGPEPNQTSSLQRLCRDYQPYTLVQCTVTATSEGTSGNNTGRTACAQPSLPTFEVKDEIGYQGQSDGTPVTRRKITVYGVAVEKLNCGSIREVTVGVYKKSQNEKWVDAGSDRSTNFINDRYGINNLDAITEYQVRVEVENDNANRNENYMTAKQYITTGELPPGPVDNLTSSSSSPKCMDLTWLVPVDPGGKITTYTVNCTRDGQRPVRDNTDELHIRVCQFSGYQLVNCSVGAKNKFYGTPTITSTRTKCDSPSLPQFQLSEELSVDKTRREISVKQIMVEHNCESLQQIIIQFIKGNEMINFSEITSIQSSVTFSNLDAVTDYIVKVVAVNNEDQQSENSSSIRTGELAPSTPPYGFKRNSNSSCVSLSWREPIEPNGLILNYMVSCWNLTETLAKDAVEDTLCGFSSATQINCSVSANNSVGWSPAATSSGYTAPKLDSKSIQPTQIETTAKEIRITINPVAFTKSNLTVEYYQFIVETISPSVRKKRDVSAVDVNQLLDAAAAEAQGLSYYVAGKISDQTGKTIEFRCGDNEMYEGFHNAKLKQRVQYKIHYTYTVELGNTFHTYLVESQASYELKLFSDGEIALIVIGGVLVVVCLIILIAYCYKRQPIVCSCIQRNGGLQEDTRETQLNITNLQETPFSDAPELDKSMSDDGRRHFFVTASSRPDPNVYTEPTDTNAYTRPTVENETDAHPYTKILGARSTVGSNYTDIVEEDGVPVEGEDSPDNNITDAYEDVSDITPQTPLPQMSLSVSPPGEEEHATPIRRMNEKLIEYRRNPIQSVIYFEFQTIKKKLRNLQPDYSNGRKHCNMLKNTGPDILPDEYSRLVLAGGSNNYINAIVLDGFKKRSEFIVTQTPLQETVSDFWLMVHEQKIINVIQLQESKIAYIPANDGESLTFDDFTISRVNTQNEVNVDIIQLEMSPPHTFNKKQKREEITVFRYLDWNDENIPKKSSLVDLYLIIKRNTRQKHRSPALIMCRNGATKCGLYVNMYSILKKLELEQIVDVYKSVLKTRSRRPQFVSDIESYADLYEIVQTFANYYSQYSNFR